ncbi:MAG: alanine--tRNA ligase [Nitrospirae bacterium]|nr:alanine--tRNA ligase [Nitrospirota bacterium]
MTADELRNKYLTFFENRGHSIVPSDSLVPRDDPTLLFTGAGMNQFKPMFLGEMKLDFRRATTCQKCFRTTDIENVGKTARHLTFLEMLGNFSFGDYFKEEAISWAWEFLTRELGIPGGKLWISVFKDDDESFVLWQKIGIPKERIVRLGEEDNFWDMGPTGPCGPCSEIIFDTGEDKGCGKDSCAVGCNCDRFLELWNLVFTQFNRQEDGTFKPLPRKNIDTGMGLERILYILEDKENIFETSILQPIIEEIRQVSAGNEEIPLRIIADHLRASTFLIADGVLPANEGRGYVLRRLIRRAVRQGKTLGIDKPFLYLLTSTVTDIMKEAYPYLVPRNQHIAQVVLSEEERFQETLRQGVEILEEMLEELKRGKKKEMPGDLVFKLYDTYGFPLNLTEELAEESGFSVDRAGFEKAMRKQQELARASREGGIIQSSLTVYNQLSGKLGKTKFVGYETGECEVKVLAILKKGEIIETASAGEEVEIILDKTPFYGESGGQVGDRGTLTNEQLKIEITATRKPLPELTVHQGKVVRGKLSGGEVVKASVDKELRQDIAANHTATHLLHNVLRQVLGEHVTQSGSLVAPDRLRFDFTHFKAVDARQLDRIEELVNKKIRENAPVGVIHTTLKDAQDKGAIALFGEKYGDKVRLVKIGNYSQELCGGTHLRATGEIGLFRIVGESSIASGVRRIEALTGREAYRTVKKEVDTLKEIGKILKAPPLQTLSRVEEILKTVKVLEKEVERLRSGEIVGKVNDLLKRVEIVEGIKVVIAQIERSGREELRSLVDSLKEKMGSGVIVLGTVLEGKAALVAGATKDLVKKGLHAGKIVKEAAKITGGSGGGREDYAQAGGKDPSKLNEALQKVRDIIREQVEK